MTKREQLDSYSSRVIDIRTNNGVLKEKELTQHMLQTKNVLKEIWDKNLEFQIQELEQEVDSTLAQVMADNGNRSSLRSRKDLHKAIDWALEPFSSLDSERIIKELPRLRNSRAEGTVRKNGPSCT